MSSARKVLRLWKDPRLIIQQKFEIEQMNKEPGQIEIWYLLVEIYERALNIPKRPL